MLGVGIDDRLPRVGIVVQFSERRLHCRQEILALGRRRRAAPPLSRRRRRTSEGQRERPARAAARPPKIHQWTTTGGPVPVPPSGSVKAYPEDARLMGVVVPCFPLRAMAATTRRRSGGAGREWPAVAARGCLFPLRRRHPRSSLESGNENIDEQDELHDHHGHQKDEQVTQRGADIEQAAGRERSARTTGRCRERPGRPGRR